MPKLWWGNVPISTEEEFGEVAMPAPQNFFLFLKWFWLNLSGLIVNNKSG